MTTATLKIFPNISKISKKSNSVPVYFRIIINGKKAEGKIPNVMLSKTDINLWNPIIGSINDSKSTHNKSFDLLKNRFNELISKSLYEPTTLNPTFIRDYLLNKGQLNSTENSSVLKYVENYQKIKVIPSAHWSKSTKKIFNKSINHFRNFLQYKKLSGILFQEIKPIFGTNFFDYLISDISDVGHGIVKNHISKESASQILKKLKSIFKDAIREEKIGFNPFDGIKIKIQHKTKAKMDISEIKTLYYADLNDRPALDLCRNLFLFQVFSGMSYCDMVNLKPQQIIESNHVKHYSYQRNKNQLEGTIIVHKYLNELIIKFKKHPYTKIQGSVVPKINLQEYNNRLKLLSDLFNLSIPNLSTHHGRHTFRQFLTESKVTDIGAIYTFMAWSRKKFMDSIYSNITQEQLIDANKLFELYLCNHLGSNGFHKLHN